MRIVGIDGIIENYNVFEIKTIDENNVEKIEMKIEVGDAAEGMIRNLFFKKMERLANEEIGNISKKKYNNYIEIDNVVYDKATVYEFEK